MERRKKSETKTREKVRPNNGKLRELPELEHRARSLLFQRALARLSQLETTLLRLGCLCHYECALHWEAGQAREVGLAFRAGLLLFLSLPKLSPVGCSFLGYLLTNAEVQ